MIRTAKDAEDIYILRAAEAREVELGVDAARADNLLDDLVERMLNFEHPITIWREHQSIMELSYGYFHNRI